VTRATVALVGAGKLAQALLPALRAAGYRVRTVASRPRAGSPSISLGDAAIVLLAVPDAAIPGVAARLARDPHGFEERVVLHHAGALGPEVLAALAKRGASVGVLHPLQSLADARIARLTLPGSAARIEGDPRAVRAARRLARGLGLRPLRLPRRTTAADRAAYHAAASLVANDLLALLDGGVALLVECGATRKEALAALTTLARGVLANAEAIGLERALTGPVARGDGATLALQLKRMARRSKDAAAAHRALSRLLLRVAARSGSLRPEAIRRVRRVLDRVGPKGRPRL